MPHPTKRITILAADIDEKMVPFIKWLNSLDGVVTEWCCQGDSKMTKKSYKHSDGTKKTYESQDMPYVTFRCNKQMSLARIVERVGLQKVMVNWWDSGLRYSIHWETYAKWKQFMDKEFPRKPS